MHQGQRLTGEELRAAVAEAIKTSGKTQEELARELEVTQGAISRASNEAATKLGGLQRRIIAHLTPFTLREERTVEYVVERSDESSELHC